MAGWLYVITGIMVALLFVGALTPPRVLQGLVIQRLPSNPVSVGDSLTMHLQLSNPSRAPRALLTIQDHLPPGLASTSRLPSRVISELGPQATEQWRYQVTPQKRGIYHWRTVTLRTAAPLGLFWCQRAWSVQGTAVVYPIILNLNACPLLDHLGQDTSQKWVDRQYQLQLSTEGLTRSLRPYRWGDALRLVHWRTSARYGELRVRELDALSGGTAVVLGLDVGGAWIPDEFEQAVMAIAAVYFYARKQNIPVQVWLGQADGLVSEMAILHALAGVQPQSESSSPPKQGPILWFTTAGQTGTTATPPTIAALPPGSGFFLWPGQAGQRSLELGPGQIIYPDQPLQPQLETLGSVPQPITR